MDLNQLLGEATEYDKKQAVEMKKPKSWLKSISAFANTVGGVLVFGITDDDEVIGIDNIKAASEYVSQKIKERISPFPNAVLRIQKLDNGKEILTVYVPQGSETPYYYSAEGIIEAYIRIGNESVLADATEQKRLILRGRGTSYDTLMSPYRYDDYAFSKLRERYKSWTGNSMTEKMMDSFGIRDSEGQLTNAGALLADDGPIRHSRLFCTRWNGLDKSGGSVDALDSAEFSGSLIILLNEGLSFVKRNMRTMWKKTADSRIEMPDYCERSVLESLVNAIIHRDYLVTGSEVHIDIYDDRLTIFSPGGMPDGTLVQDWDIIDIPSIRRNPVLADIFNRLGYMERKGSGLEKICLAYENAANYTPELAPKFFSNRSSFIVTLWNLNYQAMQNGEFIESLSEEQDRVHDGVHDRGQDGVQDEAHDENREMKLERLLEFCSIPRTRNEMQEFLKISSRSSFIKLYLSVLLEDGRLKMTLPDKPKSKYQKYIRA